MNDQRPVADPAATPLDGGRCRLFRQREAAGAIVLRIGNATHELDENRTLEALKNCGVLDPMADHGPAEILAGIARLIALMEPADD